MNSLQDARMRHAAYYHELVDAQLESTSQPAIQRQEPLESADDLQISEAASWVGRMLNVSAVLKDADVPRQRTVVTGHDTALRLKLYLLTFNLLTIERSKWRLNQTLEKIKDAE